MKRLLIAIIITVGIVNFGCATPKKVSIFVHNPETFIPIPKGSIIKIGEKEIVTIHDGRFMSNDAETDLLNAYGVKAMIKTYDNKKGPMVIPYTPQR